MKLYQKMGAALSLAVVSVHASAVTTFATITTGVDMSEVTTWVGTTGVVIVGIALGFKAISLAKRGIAKA